MTTTTCSVRGGAERLRRQAVSLAWFTVAWNVLEAVVAIMEGAAANSSALIGFGLDSTIEVSSAAVVLWQFRARTPGQRDLRALRLIAASFFALAAWVWITAGADLLTQRRPDASSVGVGLAIASLTVMPILATTKQGVGRRMGAATVVADSAQTWLCTSLSAVLLIGLLANAALGWWWADPAAALVIGAVAARAGTNIWRGRDSVPHRDLGFLRRRASQRFLTQDQAERATPREPSTGAKCPVESPLASPDGRSMTNVRVVSRRHLAARAGLHRLG